MASPPAVVASGVLQTNRFRPRPLTTASLLRAVVRRVTTFLQRRIDRRRETQRMLAVRANPADLQALLSSAAGILVICYGNIIRSACAARMIADALGDVPIAVRSAGLEAVEGRPSHPLAITVGRQRGLDLSSHVSTPLHAEAIRNADVILVMEIDHLVSVARRFPGARAKTFLLTCCSPDVALEVGDPVDGDEAVFRECFDQIASAVHPIIRILSARVR
jgi:protein-tyrosine phosphatase